MRQWAARGAMKRHQRHGASRLPVMPIMMACIMTWSASILSNFILSKGHRRSDVPSEAAFAKLVHERSSGVPISVNHQVRFIEDGQLNMKDHFSATWLQPLENFMKMEVDKIESVEDGCFQAFRTDRRAVRMTLDWLDFSVEHMSKWWKVAKVFGEEAVPYNKAVTSFRAYSRSVKADKHKESPLRETFAIIAFQPYSHGKHKERARSLTTASLAATIASLLNVGIGRVVVAGMNKVDKEISEETFRYLRDTVDASHADDDDDALPVSKIGPMEVGYVKVHPEEAKSKFIDENMPKGALDVLQHAFKGDLDPIRTIDLMGMTTDKSYWKYILLTEPDTILQTKPWALPQLKNALDEGFVLAPHRLQPLPHEADMIGMKSTKRYVRGTGSFASVINLNALEGAVCCDEQAGAYKPFMDHLPEGCGNFWWLCGFDSTRNENANHNHLTPYSLIRLQQGTGIVSLAATAHGRRCFPQIDGVCVPSVSLNWASPDSESMDS